MKEAVNLCWNNTYCFDRHYIVDIFKVDDTYEAWLYNREYGIKDLMFGMPVEQQSFDEFLEIVEANVPEYIELYKVQHEDTPE